MNSYYVWTCPAEKFLRRFYEERGAPFIAEWLHIPTCKIHKKAWKLGLKTLVARGIPFASTDPRRGPGAHIERKQRVEIK